MGSIFWKNLNWFNMYNNVHVMQYFKCLHWANILMGGRIIIVFTTQTLVLLMKVLSIPSNVHLRLKIILNNWCSFLLDKKKKTKISENNTKSFAEMLERFNLSDVSDQITFFTTYFYTLLNWNKIRSMNVHIFNLCIFEGTLCRIVTL